ncbi:MAG TPA: hypothetical protein VF595_12210 [Tepidisphaeraceae bacterium]|jgi:hypothetical protein
MHHARQIFSLVIIVLMVSTQSGCMTGAMWHEANTKELTGPVAVTVHDVDGPAPRFDAVYRLPGTWWGPTDYLFAVPPESADDYVRPPGLWANRPASPLAPANTAPDGLSAGGAIPLARFVRRVTSKDETAHATEAKKLSLMFPGVNPPNDVTVFIVPRSGSPMATGATVRLLSGENVALTERTLILAFPTTQARPEGDRGGALVRAALLTPFTLAADIVITPVLFFGRL